MWTTLILRRLALPGLVIASLLVGGQRAFATFCWRDSQCRSGCKIGKCQNNSCVQYKAAPAGTVCRTAVDECDQAETCNGVSKDCPSDVKKPAGTLCSSDFHDCTLDQCDGRSNKCRHPKAPAGTVCRAAVGECDIEETCNGVSKD
jgi:hypothetical protein